jgi:hypothetical protein
MFQYDEHEQNLQGDGRHGEEVQRNHLREVNARNVSQVWPGGRGSLRRIRETVRSEISMPSIFNSP